MSNDSAAKLTEDRIKKAILDQIYHTTNNTSSIDVDKAASAIYSLHEAEVKELKALLKQVGGVIDVEVNKKVELEAEVKRLREALEDCRQANINLLNKLNRLDDNYDLPYDL